MGGALLDSKVFCESDTGYATYWIDSERIYEKMDIDGDGQANESALIDSKVVEFSCRLNEDVIAAFKQQFLPFQFNLSDEPLELWGLGTAARVYLYPESTRLEIRRFAPERVNEPSPLLGHLPERDLSGLSDGGKFERHSGPTRRLNSNTLFYVLDMFFTDPFLSNSPYVFPSMTILSYRISKGQMPELGGYEFGWGEDEFAMDDVLEPAVPESLMRLRDLDGVELSLDGDEVVLKKADSETDAGAAGYTLWLVNKTRGWESKKGVRIGHGARLTVSAIEGDRILVFGSTKEGGSDVFGSRYYEVGPGSHIRRCDGDCGPEASDVFKDILTGPTAEAKEGTDVERKGINLFSW